MQIEIKPGDTLSELARKYGTTVDALVASNKIEDKDRIFAGKTLAVPDSPEAPTVENAQKRSAARMPAPWTMSPPGMVMGGIADMLGLPNTPAPLPGAPAPIRAAMGVGQKIARGLETPQQQALQPVDAPWEMAAGVGGAMMAMPRFLMSLAKMAPRMPGPTAFGNMRGAGQVAEPMARGAVPHAGATPTFSNVRPLANQGAANAMAHSMTPEQAMSSALQKLPPMRGGRPDPQIVPATTIKPNPARQGYDPVMDMNNNPIINLIRMWAQQPQ